MTIGLVIAQIMQNAMYAPLAPLLSEMFGTEVRYSGVSIGYQTASLIGAGFTPLIATSLVAANDGGSLPLSLLIILGAGITVVAILRISESRGRDLTADITPDSV